jgi:cytochrome c oxidase subunit II
MSIHNLFNTIAFSPAEWMGLPKNYSAHGDTVGHMIDVVTWFMIALFIGWTIFFLVTLVKFRQKKNPKASYYGVQSHLSTHLEVGVVIVEAVLLLGFALPLWSERTDSYDRVLEENPVRVRAIGFQFNWKFHYAGEDGKFGFIDRSLVSSKGDACLVPDDKNGFDDFVADKLRIPVGRPVILQVTSTDVIHNFSIIPMRIQQDAFPGKDIPMWFTPKEEMETSVVCGQLCGSGHANMVTTMTVESQKSFNEFHKQRSDESKAESEKIYAPKTVTAK